MRKKLLCILFLNISVTAYANQSTDIDEFNDLANCAGVVRLMAVGQGLNLKAAKYYENTELIKAKYEFLLTVGNELEKKAKKLKIYKAKKYNNIEEESFNERLNNLKENGTVALESLNSELNRCALEVGYDPTEAMRRFEEKFK